ncbi:hypothetical protein [Arenimonas fontis]|uniref:Uncharacterized protein n=1 Tax=Arenimonas fontis TaxID=2608255 RepID=A0A5B2Z9Q2_9GAMM|nr:hypothetical protein [Arenimonas fontis]KAA2284253.1 hypothetical protein F0415_10175 [Arenimonas fontis]
MSKKLLLVVVGVAMLVASAFYIGRRSEQNTPSWLTSAPEATPPLPATETGAYREDRSAEQKHHQAGERDEITPAALEMVQRYDIWGARNVEEARWLAEQGYPDGETAERYSQLSDQALETLANEGDSLARLLRAERMAANGDFRNAVDDMYAIASDGSVYSLERLALLHGTGPHRDPLMSEAYLQAARLRGNYLAPQRLDVPADPMVASMTSAMAQAIIDRLNQMRQQRGLPPLPYSPRPGAARAFEEAYIEWHALMGTEPASTPGGN